MSDEKYRIKLLIWIIKGIALPVIIGVVLTVGEPSIVEAIAVRIGGVW